MPKAKKLVRKKIDVPTLQRELARAHVIISLLSLGLISLLALGANEQATFDPSLSAIGVVLLIIVVISSINAAVKLLRK